MINIILVDDHQMVIDGLKALLGTIADLKIVGEANDGIDLKELLSKTSADLIMMDISMPRMNGIEATKMVKEISPTTKVLILSMHETAEYSQHAINAGVDGFLLKNAGKEEIQLAIQTCMKGDTYYSKKVMENVVKGLKGEESKVDLSDREIEVLKLIAKEFTTKEIAEEFDFRNTRSATVGSRPISAFK